MKTITIAMSILASGLLGACTDATGVTDPIDEPGEEVPGDEDPVPGCTAATDTVPVDELVTSLRAGTTTTHDIERAPDGTIYFVSNVTPDRKSSTIGRRVPCGAIEREWLNISAPISDVAISTDNRLYMGASNDGDSIVGRLYRLDLDDTTAFPERLVTAPGAQLITLQPARDGRVYFLEGTSTRTIRYVDGDAIGTVNATLPFKPYNLAVRADRSLLVLGIGTGVKLATVAMPTSGPATVTMHAMPSPIGRLRADINGGFYGDTIIGRADGTQIHVLAHVPVLGGAETTVHVTANFEGGVLPAYGLTDDTSEVLVLTPHMTETITSVALPVPLATL